MECNKEIHAKCDIMIATIEEKRKILLDTVKKLKDKRRIELETEFRKLQEINESLIKSQSECKDIATKSDISVSLRTEQMAACIDRQNEMEKKVDYDIYKIDTSNIQIIVKYDQKAFDSNFNAAVKVDFDDKKFELKHQIYGIQILQFSTEFISQSGLQLSDNNKCVKRINESGHTYVLADIEAVTTGVHCWRIKVEIFHQCLT